VIATLFNLYGKVKNVFGFGILDDESDDNPSGFGTGGWREGRALIDREIQSRSEGGGTVGLAPRGDSLDIERGAGSATAGTSTPPRRPQRDSAPSHIQEANRQFNSITNQQEDEDDMSARHFYDDFTERVKNTFDTIDRPDWMRNLGNGIKMPKWMQNDQRDEPGGSSLSRWFGGRPEDGRVRL
jgi:hypothetical protein